MMSMLVLTGWAQELYKAPSWHAEVQGPLDRGLDDDYLLSLCVAVALSQLSFDLLSRSHSALLPLCPYSFFAFLFVRQPTHELQHQIDFLLIFCVGGEE